MADVVCGAVAMAWTTLRSSAIRLLKCCVYWLSNSSRFRSTLACWGWAMICHQMRAKVTSKPKAAKTMATLALAIKPSPLPKDEFLPELLCLAFFFRATPYVPSLAKVYFVTVSGEVGTNCVAKITFRCSSNCTARSCLVCRGKGISPSA